MNSKIIYCLIVFSFCGVLNAASEAEFLKKSVSNRDKATIRNLLRQDVNLNMPIDSGGNTALHYAIDLPDNQFDFIKFLLNRGASPDVANKKNETPLDNMLKISRYDLAGLMLKKSKRKNDAALKARIQSELDKALIKAVLHNNVKDAGDVLDVDADPNAKDSIAPVLYHAIDRKNIKMIELLLANGSRISNKGCHPRIPLKDRPDLSTCPDAFRYAKYIGAYDIAAYIYFWEFKHLLKSGIKKTYREMKKIFKAKNNEL